MHLTKRLLLPLLLAAALAAPLPAQQRTPSAPDTYGPLGQPDAAEGLAALEKFRHSVVTGAFFLEIELRHLPRRGDSSSLFGRLWSGPAEGGQGTLLELDLPGKSEPARYLILNGPEPEVWVVDPETTAVRRFTGDEAFTPLGGTHFTPFLLQMPFLFWKDAAYDGLQRLRSRPTHAYRLSPPAGFPLERAGFSSIRLLVDSQFNALNEIEFLDPQGKRLRHFAVGELTRVDERWMLRWVDYRDERTRDKTRLIVLRAAVGLDFGAEVFTPSGLATTPPAVSESRIRTLGR